MLNSGMTILGDMFKVETILLEIYETMKFKLEFMLVKRVHDELAEVSKYTDLAIALQAEYSEDNDGLQEYHDKLMLENVDYNIEHFVNLVTEIQHECNSEEVSHIIFKNKFW